MTILAIDPGSTRSAWVKYRNGEVVAHDLVPNEDALETVRHALVTTVVIEWMTPRGMPTSAQEFETLYWVGRFAEAARPTEVARLDRGKIKLHLCGARNAKDPNVRAALIDRFGGISGKAAAVGTKKAPGPLYGIANDEWAALAVACAWEDGIR